MADFNALEALINAYIKQNGVQAITGQVLNGVLRGMVSALGKGWTVAGEAYPNTDPGTMTGPVAYVAHTAGTYTNFGGLVVNDGEVAFLKYNEQTWTKEVLASMAATASVDGNVGTPYVVTQFVNGVLNFAFHNMKGDPGINGTDGQDGAAAGFGTVSASVDNTVGTPAVSVQSSGPNTAKNFAFSFTGLKGETGVTSVVVTVDNTSGNPQCTASLNAGVLTLAFTGLKGAQGDTGSSVSYPFTLVNNLTTNDATQALTAAMGVQLESEITQLEHKIDGATPVLHKGNINNTSGIINGTYPQFCYSDVLNGPFTIKTKPGFYIYNIWQFAAATDTTGQTRIAADTGNKSLTEYTVQNSGYYRACIQKTDASNFTYDADNNVTEDVLALPVYGGLKNTKQDKLVSGGNIKTINGNSILGVGDLSTYTQEEQYVDNLALAKSHFLAFGSYVKASPEWVDGYYNKNDGNFYENENWKALPLIAVSPGEKYHYIGYVRNSEDYDSQAAVLFYAKDKTTIISFIRPVGDVSTPADIEITIPSGAYYIGVTAAVHVHQFGLNALETNADYPALKPRIRPNRHAELPAIAFNMDMGVTETDFTIGEQVLSLFESYGLPLGLCVKCESTISNPALPFGIWDKYKEWQNRGHDIINHGERSVTYGTNSTTITSYSEAVESILDCENALQKHGLVSNAWCSPQSTFNPDYIPIIDSLYCYGFTFNESGKINTRDADLMHLTRTGIDSLSVAQVKAVIDDYVLNNKILVLYFHANNIGGESYPNLTLENIETLIQYALGKRENQTAYVSGSDDAIRSFFNI